MIEIYRSEIFNHSDINFCENLNSHYFKGYSFSLFIIRFFKDKKKRSLCASIYPQQINSKPELKRKEITVDLIITKKRKDP